MALILVGLSHHTAPIEVRERLSCSGHDLPDSLSDLASLPGFQEAVVLSTCNRLEIYAATANLKASEAYQAICQHLARFHHVPEPAFTPFLYKKSESDAIMHLLRVASGLDSLVLGEAQILGQVREALRAAQSASTAGSLLTALFQQAITSARRIQNETTLTRGAFSIGHAAVSLASQIFADLSRATVLILGAGKMSELTARHLQASGVRFIVVANRTYDRAKAMAQQLGGEAIHYDRFPERLTQADIVIASTAAPHPIIHRATLQPVLRRRRGKPLFLIDIAVPRDIAPDVYNLENVFLYNIDDLQAVVAEAARERASEASRAESIVCEEVEKFVIWYRGREAVPVIASLRERLEQIRQDDLAVLRARLSHLSEREWQAIETATRAMMNKVARTPILRLKQETEQQMALNGARYDLMSAAREIFGLGNETESLRTDEEDTTPAKQKITSSASSAVSSSTEVI